MHLENLVTRVTDELNTALSDVSDAERNEVIEIVRKAMLDSATRTHRDMKEVAVQCCGPEADLAHSIQSQLDKQRDLLVSNLMAMR